MAWKMVFDALFHQPSESGDDRRMTAPRFDRAMARAAELHRGQLRKATTVPYISHPMAVAAIVLEHMGSESQAVAALLHDTLEDTPLTEPELRAEFGDDVAAIVVACSDT